MSAWTSEHICTAFSTCTMMCEQFLNFWCNFTRGFETGKEPIYVVHFHVLQHMAGVSVKIMKIKNISIKFLNSLFFRLVFKKKLIKTVFRPLNRSAQGSFWNFSEWKSIQKNLETRSEHLKILPLSDLVQTWCMFRLDMVMSESGLKQVQTLSQSRPAQGLIQVGNIYGSDLNQIWADLHQVWPMYAPGLNQALSRSAFVIESIPASVLIQTCPCPNETCTMSGQDLK